MEHGEYAQIELIFDSMETSQTDPATTSSLFSVFSVSISLSVFSLVLATPFERTWIPFQTNLQPVVFEHLHLNQSISTKNKLVLNPKDWFQAESPN